MYPIVDRALAALGALDQQWWRSKDPSRLFPSLILSTWWGQKNWESHLNSLRPCNLREIFDYSISADFFKNSSRGVHLNKLRPDKGFDPVVITLVICRFDPERLKPFSLPMQCTKVCTKIFPNNLASGSKINKTNLKTAIQMLILICYISPSKIVLHT